jgi:hypothetical protein
VVQAVLTVPATDIFQMILWISSDGFPNADSEGFVVCLTLGLQRSNELREVGLRTSPCFA